MIGIIVVAFNAALVVALCATAGHNHACVPEHKFLCKRVEPVRMAFREAVLDNDVLSLDKARRRLVHPGKRQAVVPKLRFSDHSEIPQLEEQPVFAPMRARSEN